MIKKLCFAIIAMGMAALVNAQEVKIGVKVGMNISSLNGNEDNLDAQVELLKKQYGHFILLFLTLIISTILKITREWFLQQSIQKDLENKNLQD